MYSNRNTNQLFTHNILVTREVFHEIDHSWRIKKSKNELYDYVMVENVKINKIFINLFD